MWTKLSFCILVFMACTQSITAMHRRGRQNRAGLRQTHPAVQRSERVKAQKPARRKYEFRKKVVPDPWDCPDKNNADEDEIRRLRGEVVITKENGDTVYEDKGCLALLKVNYIFDELTLTPDEVALIDYLTQDYSYCPYVQASWIRCLIELYSEFN